MLAAVIVTYNRKELLAENIQMLLQQTMAFDRIFVIDNCSTDGTYEFLRDQGWLSTGQLVYLRTESNIGGAGGFYTGTKAAFDEGADWIVLMDDDGKAADEHTFALLMATAEKLYEAEIADKKLFLNSLVQKDEFLSFKMGNIYTVEEAMKASLDGLIQHEANPFNGTLLSRELVAEIGYPNKQFFIKGDEVDYKQRARDAGAYIATVVESRYIHPRPDTTEKTVLGIRVPFFVEAPWKEYYACRNFTYMYKKKGWYKAILFELLFVKLLAILSMPCKKWKTILMVLKGFKDGWAGKLGATVKP